MTASLWVCPVCGSVRRDRGEARMGCDQVGTRHGQLRQDNTKVGTTKVTLAPGQQVPMVRVQATWTMP